MSDASKIRLRQQLVDRLLAGEINKEEFDILLAELREATSSSAITASLAGELISPTPDVFVASSDHSTLGRIPLRPVPLIESGIELGGFRIEECLGRGGMGEVWKAHDLVGERTVVIKLLHPELAHFPDELAAVKQMFQRVHDLNHQNICPMYLLGQDQRFGFYVVMKYIEGDTLSHYRRQRLESHQGFGLKEIGRVLGPAASALDYAHTQKIIHCDIKPQNIMVTPDGQAVQLVDFGLAAEIRSSISRLTANAVEHGGTYPYMAPEQWRGEALDGATDQYALAVVAYELLSGDRPFRTNKAPVLRMCVLNDTPAPIDGIDPQVNAALQRGLAKLKTDRFPSCTDFVNALCEGVPGFVPGKPPEIPIEVLKSTLSDNVTKAPRENRRLRQPDTDVVPSDDSIESPIRLANQKAVIWVGLVAGLFAFAFFGLTLFLAVNYFRSDLVKDPGPKPLPDPESPKGTLEPLPEPSIRYHWQMDRSHIYTVNLEIDQDHERERVLTYSGNLAFSVSPPPVQPADPNQELQGTGTAFVVHPDGYLLTCHHVTGGATKLEVAIAGKTYEASIVAEDAEHDLALIRIDETKLPFLPLADSDGVEQGEEVRAIGFPLSSILGSNIKATRGTISGINQDDGRKVLQIDAPINPGNSGGPLVNEKGEVIGVIYAKLVENVAAGVGFATPVNDAKSLLKSEQVRFVNGQSNVKLEGPDLVKRVSAATALVTVTAVGPRNMSRGRISLRCDGTLNPKAWRRSGQQGEVLDPQGLGRSLVYSSMGTGTEIDQVETDSMGRIFSVSGLGNLPSFLGPASRLILERMPLLHQKNWSYSHPVTLSIHQEQGPQGPELGPRMPPIFMPGRFGPRSFGVRPAQPLTREYPGKVHVSYELGGRVEDLQTIHKVFELKTDEIVGQGPRVQLKGEGDFILNTRTGLPEQMEFSATLVENDPDGQKTTPIKLTYKYVEGRQLPPRETPMLPPPALSEKSVGKPVDAESVVEVGSKMICDWAGKWLPVKVLAVNTDGTIRIHWEGWSDQWDEDAARSRLRFPAR